MRNFPSLICDNPCSPEGVLDEARRVAERIVRLNATEAGTKEAAIYSLSRRYGLGSWLRRLCRGDKVSVHLYLYRRLCRALEATISEQEARLAHDRAVLAAIEANHAAPQEHPAADRRPVAAGRRARLTLASGA